MPATLEIRMDTSGISRLGQRIAFFPGVVPLFHRLLIFAALGKGSCCTVNFIIDCRGHERWTCLLLVFLWQVSQLQPLSSHIHELEVLELANVIDGRLVYRLRQVEHLQHIKRAITSCSNFCSGNEKHDSKRLVAIQIDWTFLLPGTSQRGTLPSI